MDAGDEYGASMRGSMPVQVSSVQASEEKKAWHTITGEQQVELYHAYFETEKPLS